MLLVGIWIYPVDFWVAVMPRAHAAPGTAAVLLSLAVVSFQCFALLGLFLSGLRLLNRDAPVLQPADWCDVPWRSHLRGLAAPGCSRSIKSNRLGGGITRPIVRAVLRGDTAAAARERRRNSMSTGR